MSNDSRETTQKNIESIIQAVKSLNRIFKEKNYPTNIITVNRSVQLIVRT